MQGGFWSGLGWVRRLFGRHDPEIGVHLGEVLDRADLVWGTEMNTQTGEVRRVLGPAFRPPGDRAERWTDPKFPWGAMR